MDAKFEPAGNVLRFERRFRHPVEKVWRAITEPAELAHWFPARVETDLRIGAPIRFTFPDAAPIDGSAQGEILELDPPKVYAFTWNRDVLRFELVPDGAGCVLHFSQSLGGGELGALSAGRNAAGWDHCLGALLARLEGRESEPFTEWLPAMEHYIDVFGIGAGRFAEGELGFARDLVWKPLEDIWQTLVEGGEPQPGGEPPLRATNGHVEAGAVTKVEAPRLLEYEWLHEGEPAGVVRFEFFADPDLGNRVELHQTLPARLAEFAPTALAAWHTHLELFFAAVHGEVRCPWPADRMEALRKQYSGQG
ncbi:SRPBCC family protein [Amycolatopsis sp.]|uniref:SRPBCC family protein n=1 Tax=Amycolatopsis sp. TaxID=37632 RepID=UPI002C64CA52|nr:SRPBCC family protein [Amycolatopsis sp.]HVV13167.1 SRPBCC family protein [Amycolatopsis sp.]